VLPKHIENIISNNKEIVKVSIVGGGCISKTFKIELSDETNLFVKYNTTNTDSFKKEANGLQELAKSNCIRIPKVIKVGNDFLILEFIETANKVVNQFDFGVQLAKLHKQTSTKYGFYEDNYIGNSIQKNTFSNNWVEFFYENRLVYQLKIAEDKGIATPELIKSISCLEKNIHKYIENSDSIPSLLHGDLWNGNYLVDNNNKFYLIDPAVYYGNRETDIAMTKLFGGFSPDFYNGYESEYPLNKGFERRLDLYNIYHILNHYNLFGGGYYSQIINLLKLF